MKPSAASKKAPDASAAKATASSKLKSSAGSVATTDLVRGGRMTREERARRYGVDCPDSLTWRHWTPGGEYLRKLIIKNTHDRLQVVRYNLPTQKATFFVEFPEPVTLSSGMHYELLIRFRPTALVEMHDSIEIIVDGRGSFEIGLDALTPYAKLTVPEKHDFAFCPVNATTSAGITITNSGTVPLDLNWSVPAPFTIEPASLHLAEGQASTITVSFRPSEALAVVAKAVCRRGDEDNSILATMMLSGIGKFTYLRTLDDTKHIDFGEVLTGKVETKVVNLENRSCVAASFSIKRTDHDIVCPFTMSPLNGVVPPDGRIAITIKYKPESTSAQYSSCFKLSTVGGNTVDFNCFGTAIGPSVTLSVKNIDFGDVDLESNATVPDKFLVLKNRSPTEINFQFIGCEPGNAFTITPFAGTLGPNKMQNIAVSFKPATPLNYLRRVYCLIKHTDKALHLNLLGTGYNSKLRPAPFSLKQVRYYHLRLQYGLGRITPDEIEKLLTAVDANKPPADEEEEAAREALLEAIDGAELDPAASERLLRTIEAGGRKYSSTPALPRGTEPLANVLPADDRLHLPYSFEEVLMRFRHSALGEVKTVVVRNHTSTKATACWVMPRDPNSPWVITPDTADIAAFGSTSFQLRLKPSINLNGTFGHILECFVFHKAMRSFRLVNDATFTPAQCLTLHCQCVTQIGENSATPQAQVPTHIAFPACHTDDCTFQVVPLTNLNDTIAAFDIHIQAQLWRPKGAVAELESDPHYDDTGADADREALEARDVFTCFPSMGTIPPNGTALVLFRFSPSRLARYRGIAVVSFNESSVGGRQIALSGQGFVPQISLDNGGVLSLRPTAVGGATERTYVLENPSRIPVNYVIRVPDRFRDVLRVSPETGVMKGCSKAEVVARFSPQTQRRYEVNLPITVTAVDPPKTRAPVIRTQVCRAVGEGVIGVVAMEPLQIEFGTVLVGADARRTFTIFNSSLCDVQYRLSWIATRAEGTTVGAPKLTFIQGDHGTLRARSHVNVDVSLTLPYRGDFEYQVYVVTHGSTAAVDSTEPTVEDILRLPHCTVTVSGGHPTLEVTDVRAVYQRKSHLWRQMSVVQLNQKLKEPVLPQDTETASFTFENASAGLEPLVCDLGVDTYRTAPIRVLMRLDNVGHCPVNFRFWLPHESDVPKEPWHQDPVKGSQDLQLAEIIDRGLFDIAPRRGTIAAGGHVVLLFTYAHTKVGQHSLPVMLRLDKGKRLLLHLTARTLSESARYLALHHTMTHELLPVAIGDLDPPLQYTELQNLSHHTIVYNIDSDALAEVREKNYDFPVFQCLNPQGVIPPMSTLLLSWYFRPLEAKRYVAKIPIAVEQGDSYSLTITGEGYHPLRVTPKEVQAMHARDVFPLPAVPTLRHPMLPLRLSLDVLRFGAVPQHTLHRRMVVLENHHPKDTFVFEWHSALQYGDQLLDVDPPRGRIAPGESVRMRVSLYTGSTSHIVDNPIHCHVLNEDLRNRRLARREAQEREAAMQLDVPAAAQENGTTMTYSDTRGSLSQVARESRKKETAEKAAKTRLPITSIPAKFQSTGRLKQAIQALTEAAAAEELDDDDEEQTYVDVLPTVLEVLVQTRIMSVESYAAVYGDSSAHRHYYPTFRAYSTPVAPAEASEMAPFSSDELHVARDVIDEFLQKIVHNRAVEDAYCDVAEDPVPYFCQIRHQAGSSGAAEDDGFVVAAPADGQDVAAADEPTEEQDKEDGELQCLVEEVLESLIFDLISDDKPGAAVRSALLETRTRSRTAGGAAKAGTKTVSLRVAQ